MDTLDNEIFTCMYCQKPFNITQGTFPQYMIEPNIEYNMDADSNNRTSDEFVCYDCLD